MEESEIKIKTEDEIMIMAEGGQKLGGIKKKLSKLIAEGVRANEVEELANKLINEAGGKASFKMAPGYRWATCVNVNQGVVHGIPKQRIVFKKGDIVSVDIGLFYKGFHTDTSFTVGVDGDSKTKKFLEVGKEALKKAISKTHAGNRIFDISKIIQDTLEAKAFSPIRVLVGHGVGKDLHEPPQIPCFVTGEKEESPEIPKGAVLAIEVMYAEGKPDVAVGGDGWTIETKDGKMAGLFEETVAVTGNGPLVLTEIY